VLLALSFPAPAQDNAEGVSPGGASVFSLAQALYAEGAARGDAIAVLAAATMAASVSLTKAEPADLDSARITFEGEGPFASKRAVPAAKPDAPAPRAGDGVPRAVAKAHFGSPTSEEEGGADGPVSTDAMFAKAKELAAGDDALLDVIGTAMAEGPRRLMEGAVSWPSRLSAGSSDVWEIAYHGDAHAEIAVVGDGDANLDVVVTDENGNVLCHDAGWSDWLYCEVTPAGEGYFYVTVENVGDLRNSYFLITN
jgi:hypothetical protein